MRRYKFSFLREYRLNSFLNLWFYEFVARGFVKFSESFGGLLLAREQVIIVGGGVIGTTTAYYLQQSGYSVTILEKNKQFGKSCSDGNCGLVCPSHVLPLATPGAIQSTLKAMFAKNSAFRIKPRLDFTLWSWLLRFARRCNHQQMLESAVSIQALLNSSRQLYQELITNEKLECDWETVGLLFVFQSQKAFEHYQETDHLLRESFQMGANALNGDELLSLEPALKPGVCAGAWHYPGDAHLRPDRLMIALRKILQNRGVIIHSDCEWQGLEGKSGKLTSVITSKGTFEASHCIIATGAVTPLFQERLGCKIPIQPGKGYSITMPRPAICPKIPMIFEEHRVAVTPMKSGYRIGSTMEFSGYDDSISPKRLELLRDGAKVYLQEPYCEPVQEEWFGWRPMTYDSRPIIDRSPKYRNVWIAAGHNMLGLSMAPATGKLIAELLSNMPTHLPAEPYQLKRF